MPRLVCSLTVAVVLAGGMAPVVRADLDPEKVRAAIAGGVAYLKSQQQRSGAWPDYRLTHGESMGGGVTGLCTLALLSAGVGPADSSIQNALAFLRRLEPRSTYVVSLQTMVMCAAEPQQDLLHITRNVRWLEAAQIQDGDQSGGWDYTPARTRHDNSNAQFAVLALHEAERIGVPVKEQTWRRVLRYWLRAQNKNDGSWSYDHPDAGKPHTPGYGSMTCAGIASLIIASGRLGDADATVEGNRVQCCAAGRGASDEAAAAIDKGLAWLGRPGTFAVTHHPGVGQRWAGANSQTYHYYYLYGLERVGRMTSQRLIGGHDWYRAGTEYLLSKRDGLSGFWVNPSAPPEDDRNIATAMSLLFLAKGRRPVLLAKLQHGDGDDWNHHRHDVDNLTRITEQRWKMDLTWQVVAVAQASADDLRQSPVLFLSGKQALPITAAQKKALRTYLDQGGFLFAENCCDSGEFDRSFRKLMEEMFPDSRLAPLEDRTHPIWTMDENLVPALPKFLDKHPVLLLHSACRVSVVYTPKNLGCYWELSRPTRERKYPPEVQAEIDFCTGLGVNVLAYATNRELKFKYDIPIAGQEVAAVDAQRGTIYVAKLQHAGGCDEAAYALRNLLRTAAAELKLRISDERRMIPISDKRLFDYHLVFMHGRRDFRLSDAERKQLRLYVERGGTVLADSVNSSPQFTAAFRREMQATFPGRRLETLAATHPLIKPDADNRLDAFDISSVTFREPVQSGAGERRTVKQSRIPARLEAIAIDDRLGVIFSPYDLSCALENHESLETPGYARDDAKRIGLNVLLYSLRQ